MRELLSPPGVPPGAGIERWRVGEGVAVGLLLFISVGPAIAADAVEGEKKSALCTACHGPGGNSTDPQFPSLAAQPPTYTFYQLLQFREERRKDPRMSPFAAKLSDADMKDIAAYFAAQKVVPPAITADAAKVAAGRAVSDRMYCGSCHTSTYYGQNHIA